MDADGEAGLWPEVRFRGEREGQPGAGAGGRREFHDGPDQLHRAAGAGQHGHDVCGRQGQGAVTDRGQSR